MVRSDKRSVVWVCLWGMELEEIMPVRLIEEQCTLKYWLICCQRSFMLQWPLVRVQQQQYLGKGLFPMNICSIWGEEHMVSLRWVQQLSSGKSLLTVWSLAKQEEKTGHRFCYWFGSLMSCCSPQGYQLQPYCSPSPVWSVLGGDSAPDTCSPLPGCVIPDALYYHLP